MSLGLQSVRQCRAKPSVTSATWLAYFLVMIVLICFFGSLLFCNCCSSFGLLPYLRERRPSMELSFQRRAAFVGLPSILRGSADWPFASSVSHFIYTNRCDRFHLSVWRRLVCCSVGDTVSTASVPAAHRYSRHLSQTHRPSLRHPPSNVLQSLGQCCVNRPRPAPRCLQVS